MSAMETDGPDAPPPAAPAPAAEGSSAAGPSSSRKPAKRFEIKKWNAVALWAWGTRTIRPTAVHPLTLVFGPV
jgi:RING-box protein 1